MLVLVPGSPSSMLVLLQAGMDGAGLAVPDKPEARLPDSAAQAQALQDNYQKWQLAADAAVSRDPMATIESSAELAALMADLRDVVGSSDEAAAFFGTRLIKHLWEGNTKAHASVHTAALRLCVDVAGGVSGGGKQLVAQMTDHWVKMNVEAKFNREIGEGLLRHGLLLLPEIDVYMAKVLAATRSSAAIDFAMLLLKFCREGSCGWADISATFEQLGKLAASLPGGETVLQLLQQARLASRARAADRSGVPDMGGLKDKGADPGNLHQQVAALFEDWARRCMANPGEKLHAAFVNQLRTAGLLKMDDTTDRMLRILIEMAVNHCLASESVSARPDGSAAPGTLSYLATDPLVKLVVCLTVAYGGADAFFTRVLSILVSLIRRDAEDRAGTFNARPYLRILVGLALDLGGGSGDANDLQGLNYLRLLALALLSLQPLSVPAFAFAYLEMLSHRSFMPRLLTAPTQAGWPLFEGLLVGLLTFLEPALRSAEMSEPLRVLYKGTLRLLLVLLHDFPEFLCEHHYRLCDVIPVPAIQMRNLILSAFPRNMRLPDPFTPNLKVDRLPEISMPPRGAPAAEKLLPQQLRQQVDALLRGAPLAGVSQLIPRLMLPPEQQTAAGGAYNVPLINALVLYIGGSSPQPNPAPGSPPLELFARLAAELQPEARYLLLNAIANQLRYPNSHTHYFSCVLLSLFAEAAPGPAGEAVQEQITRVLLERLIVNRPHPWGLLITFIELIKNPHYNFWAHSFTRCALEIERLFESVARSCMGPNAAIGARAQGVKPEGDDLNGPGGTGIKDQGGNVRI